MKKDQRGFREYLSLADSYGANVHVKESSSAEGAHVWIFINGGGVSNNDGSAHLSRRQAKRVHAALARWLRDTE